MNNTERVIFNTFVLYGRLIISMILGLVTTRLVLDALGETNYGIYVLVAGVVGMLGVLQSAMSSTSMRYMAHSLGKDDEELISKTFNTTLFLHVLIGVAVVLIIEGGGYFMFKYFLDIPQEKLFEAKVIFHLMALTTFVAIVAVPYDAVINSHENLLALSVVDVLGAILKLGIAIYLTFTSLNLLIIYGLGMFLVQLIKRIIKQQYSLKNYQECHLDLRNGIDKELAKEIMSFSGWNLFGSIGSMAVNQVRSILLNMFFGVKVNASEGIAKKGSNKVNMVSVNLTRAINPFLVKTEGSGDREKMLRITSISTKFSVYLFSLFAVPVIIELPYLFGIWLKDVPEYAVVFTRLILLTYLIEKLTFEITTAIRAVGRIKEFQVTETVILLFNVPVTFLLFEMGYPPKTIYIVGLIFNFLISGLRLFWGKKITELDVMLFLRTAILPSIIPLVAAALTGIVFVYTMNESFMRLIYSSLSSIIILLVTVRYFFLTEYEYSKIVTSVEYFKQKTVNFIKL